MQIRPFQKNDLQSVIEIWNQSVDAKEVLYYRMDEAYFTKKFLALPTDKVLSFVATEDEKVIGFVSGTEKQNFLNDETKSNTPGYLTCIFVQMDYRGHGVGRALINTLQNAFKEDGKTVFSVSSLNPVNLDWIIPNTPHHDHNNAPGVDEGCQGYGFLKSLGFEKVCSEIAMYLDLSQYKKWDRLDEKQKELLQQGIFTGIYDAHNGFDYETMCDNVGSAYWKSVLKTEIQCHLNNTPCTDERFLPNGKIPQGPRPILVATTDNKIIAFTGPVDKQISGRGFFTGICTDPNYERRGIASVLFNLLMMAFIKENATFSTLFTGDSNHAQRIYRNAGFKIARRFAIMKKDI